jgi:UDP:flavonoid glycosyltransferase YjiC (YdhE family)
MRPAELHGIAKACETLQPLWELLTEGPINDISFTDESQTTRLDCYDSNGDMVGFISWSEAGPAFYLSPWRNSRGKD